MKLKVPFFKQTTALNCGPTALRMVLAYFGKDPGIDILGEKTGIKEGKAIFTIQIATAAVSLGYKADFYSKHILLDERNLRLDFYKKYSDLDLEQSRKLVEDAKTVGVNIKERKLRLEELLSKVTENSVPIVLIDWNIAKERKEKGYQGHFVPIAGYDNENIYIHNPGFNETQKFMPIKRNIFDKARKALGTDEDIVIVHKN